MLYITLAVAPKQNKTANTTGTSNNTIYTAHNHGFSLVWFTMALNKLSYKKKKNCSYMNIKK